MSENQTPAVQWEYDTAFLRYTDNPNLKEHLNGSGWGGWELVFGFPFNDGMNYIFKRQIIKLNQ